MKEFVIESGVVAPMLAANIDTDVIMPKQFLLGIDRKGLDRGVFYDHRFLKSGEHNPDFVLNKPRWSGAKFLVVGPNFGCGSSREHAVWGLQQLGIRALIGTSFAGIFFDNCQRNGLLAIELDSVSAKTLGELVESEVVHRIRIDLPAQTIDVSNRQLFDFEIDPLRKNAMLNGLDGIGMTMRRLDAIESFERTYLDKHPWLN